MAAKHGWIQTTVVIAGLAATGMATAQRAPGGPAGPSEFDAFYTLGPDSLPRDGVPLRSEVRGPFKLCPVEYIPGVEHSYWVYVPAQYGLGRRRSLMVFNDGATYLKPDGFYRARNVLDNLIYRGDIPVMIGAFADPGACLWRMGNRTARKSTIRWETAIRACKSPTSCCRPCARTTESPPDADRHGIAGWSSGAIAAFTVAWERPDLFRKVLSGIGTFVDLRGGHVYPEKVLATEKKPIRIFMIDGRNDNRGTNAKGEYDPHRGLVPAECAIDAGADGQGLRRQLLMGNGAAQPQHGRRDVAGDVALAMARSASVGGSRRQFGAIIPFEEVTGATARDQFPVGSPGNR